jgi:SAM-dependent methyltransferase
MSEDGATGDDAGGIDAATQRRAVRERYGAIADASTGDGSGCCDTGTTGCCGPDSADASGNRSAETAADSREAGNAAARSTAKGYTAADLAATPAGADLDLGCGNPTAIASLEAGERVLDLGAGAGFDCFLAAREVGPEGDVLGVDMTPEMVETARENAAETDVDDVEFRLGEIEHLPVADATVDVVVSNCVVNLSPDKPQVFAEAFRVLRPGGRVAISDVVTTAEIPDEFRADPESVAACIAGASSVPALESMLADAGFVDVVIEPTAESAAFVSEWDAERDLSEYVVSATIEARKPRS